MRLPKLIVSDLDGTLLPESKVLTAATREVLSALMARGVRFAVATGKFHHLAAFYGEAVGPETGVVALDGNRVTSPAGSGGGQGIPREIIEALVADEAADGLPMFADSGEDELLLRGFPDPVPDSISHWADRIHHVDDLRPRLVGEPALLCIYAPRRPLLEAMAARALARFPELRAGVFPSSAYGEARVIFQRKGVTKGSGVLELCTRLAIAPEEALVIGDWHNDLSMFEVGAVNVAMANAVPELKARANHVTPLDCERDGVADFLRREFL